MRAGDIFVLDNLTAHHASRIESVAREGHARVLWPAPYSPDFSPIELLWSKIKTGLRKAKARTVEELSRALSKGLELVTANDCRSWFKHCGYSVALK
jgi:transposase